MRDLPGANVGLRPELAPTWLRPVIANATAADLRRQLGISGTSARPVRQSAVLALFAGDPDAEHRPTDARLLLTHRSPTMRTHAGQIAFPGGRMDPTDVNPVDTALREAWEETGLNRADVVPLAQLPSVHVRSSSYPVHPIVAYWKNPRELYPASEIEVNDVFTTTIDHLIAPENRLTVGYGNYSGPAFNVEGYLLWGFTAGLVAAALAAGGWEKPWEKDRIVDLRGALARSRNNEKTFKR